MTFRGFCQKSRWLWHCSCAFSVSALCCSSLFPPYFSSSRVSFPCSPCSFPFLLWILACWVSEKKPWLGCSCSLHLGCTAWIAGGCPPEWVMLGMSLDAPHLVLVEAEIGPVIHSSALWCETLDIKLTVPSKVVLWGMCSRNICFLLLFWVCFAFEDPVRTVFELCVVGSNLVEYERFMIADYLNVITRNLEVHGVTNRVYKLNFY